MQPAPAMCGSLNGMSCMHASRQGFVASCTLRAARCCQVCGGESMGKVYDLNNAVEVPWSDYEAAKAVLDADEQARTGRFDWKVNAWGLDEHVGWAMWERTSHSYFRVGAVAHAMSS